MMMDKGQVELSTRRVMLDALRIKGPMARVELAEETGLSAATVTAVTAELLEDGYIETFAAEGDHAVRRGRPRIALRLRPDAIRVAGVKVSLHRIGVSITDFAGDVLGASEIAVQADRQTPAELVALVDQALERALRTLQLQRKDLHGVGVGVPGYIDGEAGVSYWSPLFGAQKIDVAAVFAAGLKLPCFIDNDANLATLAEQWFGRGRGVANMIVVSIEHGVGMGAVIGGRLYRGARGVGSEFGHMKLRPDGALCRCGQRGCIEAYLADYALLREASTHRRIEDVGDPIAANETLLQIQEEARAGDVRLQAIYRRAGAMLGVGLANLVNIFAPELIVVTGAGVAAADLFESSMRRALAENGPSASPGRTRIEIAQTSDALWARGAAALVLQRSEFGARKVEGA